MATILAIEHVVPVVTAFGQVIVPTYTVPIGVEFVLGATHFLEVFWIEADCP